MRWIAVTVVGLLHAVPLANAQQDDQERLFTKDGIVRTTYLQTGSRQPLELEWAYPIPTSEDQVLFVTLHRAYSEFEGRKVGTIDRLAIYEAANDESYRLLSVMESGEEGGAFFEHVTSFHARGELFLHVPLIYHGTGHHREDTIFLVIPNSAAQDLGGVSTIAVPRHRLQAIEFEPASRGLEGTLRDGEGVWQGESLFFSDERLAFECEIWRNGDANCCPTAGKIVGTYHLTGERWGQESNFRMAVDTYARLPAPTEQR